MSEYTKLEREIDSLVLQTIKAFTDKNFNFQNQKAMDVCLHTVENLLENRKRTDFANLNTYTDKMLYWREKILKIPLLKVRE